MTKKQLTRCNGRWTEAQFLSFIRSTLRSKFLRYPVRYDVLKESRIPYAGEDKRVKWQYVCSLCQGKILQKDVDIDHHPIECGSLQKLEDLPRFVDNLFCNSSNLRIVCRGCHKIHTYASKENVGFEEAIRMKEAIAFSSLPSKEQIERLEALGLMSEKVKNATQRKEVYLNYLNEKALEKEDGTYHCNP